MFGSEMFIKSDTNNPHPNPFDELKNCKAALLLPQFDNVLFVPLWGLFTKTFISIKLRRGFFSMSSLTNAAAATVGIGNNKCFRPSNNVSAATT